MICRYCGGEIAQGEARCPHCGALDPVFTQASAAAAPEPAENTPENAVQQDLSAAPDKKHSAPRIGSKPQKSGGNAVLFLVLRIAAGVVIVALCAGALNFMHQHASFLTRGETVNLDVILGRGKAYPLDEFVHVDASFVLDEFANEESRINGVTSQKDAYYMIVLNSRRAIAVKAASVDDIAVLQQAGQSALDYLDGKIDTIDNVPLEGKLVELTDPELIGYFDEYAQAIGLSDADSRIRPEHYMIDMTAIRTGNFLLYVALPAAVLLIAALILVLVRKSKKKKAAAMPPAYPGTV